MTVLDILVVTMGFSNDGREVLGDVRFSLRDLKGTERNLTIRCQCPVSKRIRPDALLIGDAIRQLRRMPEIRSGEARLRFAKGLKPLGRAEAA
ncbi:MAG: hypothetical protein AAF714_10365 [Pseudomonadota bacterium]